MKTRKLRKDADPARKAAQASGDLYYMSSRPCAKGHATGLRRTLNNMCIECEKAKTVAGRGVPRKNANLAQQQAKDAGERFFTIDERCGNGHLAPRYTTDAKCRQCVSDRNKVKRESDEEFRQRANERHRIWREQNPERALAGSREWYENNKERSLANSAAWVRNNKKAVNAIRRRHYAKYQDHYSAYTKSRAQKVKKATPFWADMDAILEFYKNCPAAEQVDHMIPINGKMVCGLHVLENLQYLSADANGKKSNHWPWPGAPGEDGRIVPVDSATKSL